MKRWISLPALTCAFVLAATGAGAPDQKAREIAQAMTTAMGGADAWYHAHFLRFDFKVTANGKSVVDRAHLWDKMTGRYRVDGKTKEGVPTVTLLNVNDQKGSAYAGGKKLAGEAAEKAIKAAYGMFINDMYWLAMPWKWNDAGVNLKYLGQKPLRDAKFDVVELTFGKVGLTPGDRYEAYVSPRTHLMEHWEYTLQSGSKGSWDWEYTTTGGIKLASGHTSSDGKKIGMGEARVMDRADETLFTDAAKSLP